MATVSTALGVPGVPHELPVGEDSLIMSPISEAEERKEKKTRSRSPSLRTASSRRTAPWVGSTRLGSKIERGKRIGSAPRGRRPAPRPPSPAAPLELADHNISADGVDDVETRVTNLERQRIADHHFLTQIAMSIQTLEKHFESAHTRLTDVEEELRHPRRDLQIRQELRDFKTQMESDIVKGMEITTANIEPKLQEMQSVLVECQIALANLHDKDLKVEAYLVQLDSDRPQEGQRVVSGFESVQREIGSVREMVQKLEKAGNVMTQPMVPSSTIFTEQMRAGLATLHDNANEQKKSLAEISAGHGEVQARVQVLEAELAKFHRRRTGAVTFGQGDINGLGELNLKSAFSGGSEGCHGCTSSACGVGHDEEPPNPFRIPPLRTPPGMLGATPGEDGAGLEARLRAVIGGNNMCHCVHVEELKDAVTKLEKKINERPRPSEADPWFKAAGEDEREDNGDRKAPERPVGSLPLKLTGALGAIDFKGKSLLDDKLAFQPEYRYDGGKGGVKWKRKLENYIISRAPILRGLLVWAEAEDLNVISNTRLRVAVGSALSEEQIDMVDGGIWGFLSAALTGGAETIFNGADALNGLDAWRRMVRYIEDSKESRLEDLREEVKRAHAKPMKDLEDIKTGIAAFDNLLKEYTDAGGSSPSDQEKKSDLQRMLPGRIREQLIWHATDNSIPYVRFRDMIITQSGKVMQNQKRLPVNAVEDEEKPNEPEDDREPCPADYDDVEDYIAAVRYRAQNGKFQPRRTNSRRPFVPQRRDTPARKRKCPNCGQEHEGRCNKPLLDKSDRVCFDCGEKGHIAAQCTSKQKGGKNGVNTGVKAIEDGKILGMFMVDHYKPPRPMPRQATLGSFISPNTFAALEEKDNGIMKDEKDNVTNAIATSTTTRPSATKAKVTKIGKKRKKGVEKFFFSEDERQRLVSKAQAELVARAAEEIPDGSDELEGMNGLAFSDDECEVKDKVNGEQCAASDASSTMRGCCNIDQLVKDLENDELMKNMIQEANEELRREAQCPGWCTLSETTVGMLQHMENDFMGAGGSPLPQTSAQHTPGTLLDLRREQHLTHQKGLWFYAWPHSSNKLATADPTMPRHLSRSSASLPTL